MILFLSAQVLWAGGYRLGISGGDSAYRTLVESTLATISNVYSPACLQTVSERERLSFERAEAKRREEALLKEDFDSWNKAKAYTPSSVSSVPLEVVSLTLSDVEAEYLAIGEAEALEYIKASRSLDALLTVESRDEGVVSYVTVSLEGEKVRECWYVPALRDSEEAELLSLFSSLFLDATHHLQRIVVEPTSASLLDNGETIETTGYVVMADGKHVFSLSAYGYDDLETTLETREDGTLTFRMEEAEPRSLYVQAFPWDAEISINGKAESGTTLPEVFSPYTLSLKHDGFSFLSYQSTSDRPSVSLQMRPAWTDQVDMVREKKDQFYQSLFTVLLSYGGFVGARALNNFSSYSAEPLMVVLGGVSIVSLINLVQCAADYFSAASLGL